MDLDGEEERMLRAIVQSAVAQAAAGRSFAGEFRHYMISATFLKVSDDEVVQVDARIVQGLRTMIRARLDIVRGTTDEHEANVRCCLV
ncbi:MAG: hypothetical protein IPH55_06540 [Betaproteobacteria bacterium]|nr:hypothetical protein [Betaproteobacteria bacterium]